MVRVARFLGILAVVAICAACTPSEAIWGPDGQAIRSTTQTLIDDIQKTGASELICDDATVDIGSRSDWTNRTPGEPEQMGGKSWPEQADLSASWLINLQGRPDGATASSTYPVFVFYRGSASSACVIDVEWSIPSSS